MPKKVALDRKEVEGVLLQWLREKHAIEFVDPLFSFESSDSLVEVETIQVEETPPPF